MPLVSPDETREERELREQLEEQDIDEQVKRILSRIYQWFGRRRMPKGNPVLMRKLVDEVWKGQPRKDRRVKDK